MLAKRVLSPILDDEALTRGLGDPEARVLVEWLVDQAETLVESPAGEEAVKNQVRRLCRRGRAISRFVRLWCMESARGAALQLACAERFDWPLPTTRVDPCELMQNILYWESQSMQRN